MEKTNCGNVSQLDRAYGVMEYSSHRLAEMNGVLGRLQSTAGLLFSAAITALALISAVVTAYPVAFAVASVPLIILIITSIIMLRISLAGDSATANLPATPWFFRGTIQFDPGKADTYGAEDFNKDKSRLREMVAASDAEWLEYCFSQVTQIFITTSGRMKQVSKMNYVLSIGLILTVVLFASFLIVAIIAIALKPIP